MSDVLSSNPMTDALMGTAAALAAAISLLERTPAARKAAPSDTMFRMMLDDYRKALEIARTVLQSPAETTADPECICQGNWRALLKEFDPLIGTCFKDDKGKTWTFFGLVHTDEDYYYGMRDDSGAYRLLSCVGSLDGGHGFTAIDGPRPEGKTSLEIGLASIRPPRT